MCIQLFARARVCACLCTYKCLVFLALFSFPFLVQIVQILVYSQGRLGSVQQSLRFRRGHDGQVSQGSTFVRKLSYVYTGGGGSTWQAEISEGKGVALRIQAGRMMFVSHEA